MKDLVGFEEYYSVSENGDIFSKRNNRFLKKNLKKNGYEYIELNVKGNNSWHRVHRLVGLTWIPNPENKPYINHKNCIKSDNKVCNLEWCTGRENNIHAIENNLCFIKKSTYQIIDNEGNVIVEEHHLSNFTDKLDFGRSCMYIYKEKGYIPRGKYKSFKVNIFK